jgi:sugar lactone lactonase YvrE
MTHPGTSVEGRAVNVYAEGMIYGEGPRWHEGSLWLSDTQGSRLWTDASGEWTPIDVASATNGLWFLPTGELVAAMMHERRIGVWTGSEFATYCDLSHVALGPLGDLTGDSAGNLYVDDVGYAHGRDEPRSGQIIRVARDRSATVVTDDVQFPNGLAVVENGTKLVVAETWAQRLVAYSIGPDGGLGDRRLEAELTEIVGKDARPDGIWATPEGIWVSTLTAHQVVLLKGDRLLRSFDVGTRLPVACCVDDGSRLLVTASDTAGLSLGDAITQHRLSTAVLVFDLEPRPLN